MRRVEIVEIEGGRDAGKRFEVTEMSAFAAEWWAIRALQAIMGTDAEIDFQAPLADMARQGIAALGKVSPSEMKPLLDEMMQCVKVKLPAGGSRAMLDSDVEDVMTLFKLRKAVLDLHIGFFTDGDQ